MDSRLSTATCISWSHRICGNATLTQNLERWRPAASSDNVRDLRLVHPDGTEWAHKSTPQNDTARGKNFDQKQDIFGRDAARGWTSEVQLEAMDTEGIDVAVLYPTRGLRALVLPDMDADFAAALALAYND